MLSCDIAALIEIPRPDWLVVENRRQLEAFEGSQTNPCIGSLEPGRQNARVECRNIGYRAQNRSQLF
jgi:hypothetical protein